MNNSKHVSSSIARKKLGVHPQTLRRWAKTGQVPSIITPGGHHRYCIDGLFEDDARTKLKSLYPAFPVQNESSSWFD